MLLLLDSDIGILSYTDDTCMQHHVDIMIKVIQIVKELKIHREL